MEAIFTINSSLSKEDYRKFLYTSTFHKSKARIIFCLLVCLLGSFLIAYNDSFNILIFIIAMLLFVIFTFSAFVFSIERRYSLRIQTDKIGTFDSIYKLIFYEDKLVTESISPKAQGELDYKQFYQVIETNNYWYFYIVANQASILSKKNIRESSYNIGDFKEFIKEKFEGKYKRI